VDLRLPDQIIGVCWLVLIGLWIVLSIAGARASRRSSPSRSVLRLLLVVALVLALRYGDRIPVPELGRFAPEVAAAGVVLCVVGLAFAAWARVSLGRNWGMPMTLHDAPDLVTSGPYAYVRHPIYTGLLAMLIGTSLVYPLAAAPSAILIAYFVFSARREERDMERRFPDAYPAYKKRSKMLVPFLL
jgi:protein-S-isoprenylcysteine O-methyltransferase Ste14